jgi:hypothetical protein
MLISSPVSTYRQERQQTVSGKYNVRRFFLSTFQCAVDVGSQTDHESCDVTCNLKVCTIGSRCVR